MSGKIRFRIFLTLLISIVLITPTLYAVSLRFGNDGTNNWRIDNVIRNSNGNQWQLSAINIKRAIWDLNNTGGTVWTPPGNVSISEPIRINESNIYLKGHNTTLWLEPNSDKTMMFISYVGKILSDITIEGFTFDGNGNNQQAGLHIYGIRVWETPAHRINVKNCNFHDMAGTGLYLLSHNGSVTENRFYRGGIQNTGSMYAGAIYVCGAGNIITENHMFDYPSHGISLEVNSSAGSNRMYGNIIANNYVEYCDQGIRCEGNGWSNYTVVIGNNIRDCYTNRVQANSVGIYASHDTTVTGNLVFNSDIGIFAYQNLNRWAEENWNNINGSVISGNSVIGGNASTIGILSHYNSNIVANTISSIKGHGIQFDSDQNITIKSNKIYGIFGATSDGIHDVGSVPRRGNNVTIKNNEISGGLHNVPMGNDGIEIYTSSSTIEGNKINNFAGVGIKCHGDDLDIVDNEIKSCGGNGINIGGNNYTVTDNRIRQVTGTGISCANGIENEHISLLRNTINETNPGGSGACIYIQNVDFAYIIDNLIKDSYYGIRVSANCDNVFVKDNILLENSVDVQDDGATNIWIMGNIYDTVYNTTRFVFPTIQPSNPVKGEAYFDVFTNRLYIYNGAGWVSEIFT